MKWDLILFGDIVMGKSVEIENFLPLGIVSVCIHKNIEQWHTFANSE